MSGSLGNTNRVSFGDLGAANTSSFFQTMAIQVESMLLEGASEDWMDSRVPSVAMAGGEFFIFCKITSLPSLYNSPLTPLMTPFSPSKVFLIDTSVTDNTSLVFLKNLLSDLSILSHSLVLALWTEPTTGSKMPEMAQLAFSQRKPAPFLTFPIQLSVAYSPPSTTMVLSLPIFSMMLLALFLMPPTTLSSTDSSLF